MIKPQLIRCKMTKDELFVFVKDAIITNCRLDKFKIDTGTYMNNPCDIDIAYTYKNGKDKDIKKSSTWNTLDNEIHEWYGIGVIDFCDGKYLAWQYYGGSNCGVISEMLGLYNYYCSPMFDMFVNPSKLDAFVEDNYKDFGDGLRKIIDAGWENYFGIDKDKGDYLCVEFNAEEFFLPFTRWFQNRFVDGKPLMLDNDLAKWFFTKAKKTTDDYNNGGDKK